MSTNKKIHLALWQTPATGLLIINETWPACTFPPLCIEKQPLPLKHTNLDTETFYTAHFCTKSSITFFLYPDHHPWIDFRENPPSVLGSFNGWEAAKADPSWQLKPNKPRAPEYWQLTRPISDLPQGQRHEFKFCTKSGIWLEPPAISPNRTNRWGLANYIVTHKPGSTQFYNFTLPPNLEVQVRHIIEWRDPYHRESFEVLKPAGNSESQSSLELGTVVKKSSTTFRIFAPRAKSVEVRYHPAGKPKSAKKLPLQPQNDGTWEVVVRENLARYHYIYRIDGENHDPTTAFNPELALTDPYSAALASPAGPSIIIPYAKPQHPPFKVPKAEDLVICEVHLRDALAQAPTKLTSKERRGFAGLTKWLETGDTYFHRLGINAVELQPVHEFDAESQDEYQWGYMPCNLFAPSSCYAIKPKEGSQVEEFRELVYAFHKQGFAVILDVVLNHQGIHTPLHAIDKGYYFEMDASMQLLNWSGCGNDIRANAPMTRRLLIDSLLHWVREYDVDGFRFDLAELLGIPTLHEIEAALKEMKPDIHLIAEPWSFRGHIAKSLRGTQFSSWNDDYREFIPKYIRGHEQSQGLAYFLTGSKDYRAAFPAQTVNYIASHDDHCWIDKITENPGNNGNQPTEADILHTHLAIAILNCSIGIPMLAAGMDFLQSKQGVKNTYLQGNLNMLDYSREKTYAETAQYTRDWIAFRLSKDGQLLRRKEFPPEGTLHIYHQEQNSPLAMHLHEGGKHLLFAINPSAGASRLPVPIELPQMNLRADERQFFKTPRKEKPGLPIVIPPRSVRLWTV